MSWFTVKNLHSFKRGPKNYRQGTWSIFYTTFLVVRGRFQLFTVVSATVLWMPDRKATAMLDCEDGETEANSNCKHCQGRKCFLTLQTNKIILISEPRLLFGNMCIIFFSGIKIRLSDIWHLTGVTGFWITWEVQFLVCNRMSNFG